MAGKSSAVYGATSAVAVTASDSTVLPVTRALWVGGLGPVAVIFSNDTAAVTLAAVPAGTLLPVQVTKVMATGTTATLIIALY